MKKITAIVTISKEIATFFTKRWYALVAPNETRDEKKIDNFIKLFDAIDKHNRDNINWQLIKYREMGFSKKHIREKILPVIEAGQDNMSIIKHISPENLLRPPNKTDEKGD